MKLLLQSPHGDEYKTMKNWLMGEAFQSLFKEEREDIIHFKLELLMGIKLGLLVGIKLGLVLRIN